MVDQLIEAKEMAVRIVATGCNRTMCKGFKKGSFSTQVMYLPCRCILDFMSVLSNSEFSVSGPNGSNDHGGKIIKAGMHIQWGTYAQFVKNGVHI